MTHKNPLRDLQRFGVSVWYDYVSRSLISSGELQRLITSDGVRGVTSNPSIFEKAIGASSDYDDAIRRHARPGQAPVELFEKLAVADIQAACDLFRPLYEETKAGDGFVSLEVAPALARDAAATVADARRLWAAVARPNLMVKVPGTVEGLRAFEDLTAEGISINVTLLFSGRRYAAVAEAYLKGLERRAAAGKDLSRTASVASFFVSRVDTAVDALLERRPEPEAKALLGHAAVANAKLAYQHGKKVFGSARFATLAAKGARPQRLLWASTGTKNPLYKDTLYVDELIGADTVNTMPPATVDAFRDHGAPRPSLEERLDEARAQWDALPRFGVDREAVLAQLEDEGLKAFAKAFETLMGKLAAKRALLEAENAVVDAGLGELEAARFSERLWAKDTSLWKDDKDHQKLIRRALGWLDAPVAMAPGLGPVRAFAEEAAAEGLRHAVVLGMGGSSLCVEVLRAAFGSAPGRLSLHALDSTHPEAVAALEDCLDLSKTLFIVASKSGSTVEPNAFFDHFWGAVARLPSAAPGRRFAAITDPGTSLEKLSRERGFRKTFLNPSDVGGRFSALTLFGLVPAALAGVDVTEFLSRARRTASACGPQTPACENPALRLGAFLGVHARGGRNKPTLVLPPILEAFGLWVEQLVAESTGKEGRGILPVVGEPLGDPSSYGGDRTFVSVSLHGRAEAGVAEALAALEQAGHPVLRLEMSDLQDLGGQFILWEIAVAAAGFLIKVDPFDQPDVQSAKDRTKELLAGPQGGAATPKASFRTGGLSAFADAGLVAALQADPGQDRPLREVLSAHFSRVRPGDYIAILAFLPEIDENRRLLEEVRRLARARTTAPVTVSWGPRYLHSTGQFHKGGPNQGLFLVLGETEKTRPAAPGKPFTFAALCLAQTRGDAAAMLASGRRLLRLELRESIEGLRALANSLGDAATAAR
ncbi:MAG TPA: transaldolase [Elusimicrobia bacterium]|nr:MAG: transaldolase [Elusimicrobia bacterium GWA2_66_18]OGR70087.1 MAG: transaldolase [Elusimicrobia bacterium GWC2_65_9]HAZ08212.1 transaldolase [Elusimicrobiota bacterium]